MMGRIGNQDQAEGFYVNTKYRALGSIERIKIVQAKNKLNVIELYFVSF